MTTTTPTTTGKQPLRLELSPRRNSGGSIVVRPIFLLCSLVVVFFVGGELNKALFFPVGGGGGSSGESEEDVLEFSPRQIDGTTTPCQQHKENKPPMLGDGCYHVFLDVGANLGIHGRFLLEPDQFPNATKSRTVFDQEFGTRRDNRDFCVFAFEPNPRHHAKLEQNSKAYAAMGWRYHVIPSGVASQDGILTFYSSKGSNQNDFRAEPRRGATTIVNVTVINFPQWLQDHIFERDVPTSMYGPPPPPSDNDDPTISNNNKPKLVMKMDVEHLEYKLLPEMIVTGSLCKLDFAFIELHGSSKDDNQLKQAWDKVLKASPNGACKSFRYINADDESYALDGIPLPEPPPTTNTRK